MHRYERYYSDNKTCFFIPQTQVLDPFAQIFTLKNIFLPYGFIDVGNKEGNSIKGKRVNRAILWSMV